MNARIMKTAARHAATRAARFNLYAILAVALITGGLICKARAEGEQSATHQYRLSCEMTR